MKTQHASLEDEFTARQVASEAFYRGALDARQDGADLRAQVRAGIEAVVNLYTQ